MIKLIYSVVLAAVFMTICSTSSPVYPFNMWNDANCFFTVGRSMFDGNVVYADIYEQKGVLLYFLHGLASLISYDDFLGVWLLEIAAFSLFLFFGAKTIGLFVNDKRAYLYILPVLAATLLTDRTFYLGDSAEELVLPLYMIFIYHFLMYFCGDALNCSARMTVTDGLLIGCVLWIKFNLIAFFGGFIICVILFMLKEKAYRECVEYIGSLVMGVLLSTIPWVIYFGVNRAIDDWFYYYFYANTSLYSQHHYIMYTIVFIKDAFVGLVENSGMIMIPGLVGLAFIASNKGVIKSGLGRCAFVLSYVFTAIGIWIGGRDYVYYGFAFAVFTLFGLILCYMGLKHVSARLGEEAGPKGSCTFALVLHISLMVCAYWGANAADLMPVDKEEIAQYQFAKIINEKEDASLLNYGSLDGGFYTASGTLPDQKYFCLTNNIGLTEMVEEQNRYVVDGVTDYVVTCNNMKAPDFLLENYTLVGEKGETFGPGNSVYRLYERKW